MQIVIETKNPEVVDSLQRAAHGLPGIAAADRLFAYSSHYRVAVAKHFENHGFTTYIGGRHVAVLNGNLQDSSLPETERLALVTSDLWT